VDVATAHPIVRALRRATFKPNAVAHMIVFSGNRELCISRRHFDKDLIVTRGRVTD
jgi:hypothetical protein